MAASIYPDYPPETTSEQRDFILSNIKDWSILNGLAVRPSSAFVLENVDPSGSLAVTAPVTLFPSLFPRRCFDEARSIQTAYNELYATIARDRDWLSKIVEEYVSHPNTLTFATRTGTIGDSMIIQSNMNSMCLIHRPQTDRGR